MKTQNESIKQQADRLLERPPVVEDEKMAPYVDPKTRKQRMVPWVSRPKPKPQVPVKQP